MPTRHQHRRPESATLRELARPPPRQALTRQRSNTGLAGRRKGPDRPKEYPSHQPFTARTPTPLPQHQLVRELGTDTGPGRPTQNQATIGGQL